MMPFGNHITVCVLILTTFGPLGSIGQTCGGTLNEDTTTRNFTSPNYPERLSADVTCEWIIEEPMGQVQLQFQDFDFPPTVFGCSDFNPFLSIYDGSTASAPSLGQYCGDENDIYAPPGVVVSSSGSLRVHFYSGNFGGLLPGQGFAATFSFQGDVDHCASSPCTNGGTCVNAPNGFQCLLSRTSCMLPLGMASGDIEDSQISASTERTGYEAYKGRLNGPRAWQADVANTNQWLQVNFNTRTIITGIQTQEYDHCASLPCSNGGTCVNGPVSFQCLCPPEYVGTQCQVLKSLCSLPLGMASGDIEDSQISASTERTGYEAYKGRLNGPRAWQADVANTNQWLQVNFNNRTIITGIQTQGLWGGHVKSYRLLYGATEDGLLMYKDTGSNIDKVFDANSDGSAVVSHVLEVPVTTSIVRVNPQDFTANLIRLRIEMLGCEASTSKKTNIPLPVETTKPDLIKTTKTLWKHTTSAEDGGKAEQSGDSGGGGGNTAVFAAAGAAGGVAVLVGVGVSIFICRRRGSTCMIRVLSESYTTSSWHVFNNRAMVKEYRRNKMISSGKILVVRVLMLVAFGALGSMGQNCGGTLNKDSPTRNFTSPNYPRPVQDGVTCDWIIEAPMGQVHLQFDDFIFAPAVFGCSDFNAFVSVYDGSSTSSPSLGRYCGDEIGNFAPPDVIQSSSGSLFVRFYSGTFVGLTSGQGFVSTFSFPDHADCTDVVCQNGGTCTDTPSGYSCFCAAGFTGLQCETENVDYCASSPCTNDGTCVNVLGGFQCECTSEYVGTQCQVLKSSCLMPLGMESGYIEDSQISASTEKTGYEAYKGRLNGPRAWQANIANTNQWLQVNFTTRTIITGIQTQGLWGGHVKSYRLLYGDAEDGLSVYKEPGSDGSKVFDANSDGVTVVSHDLDVPIIASIARVNPQSFTNNLLRLRMELLGCEEPALPLTTQPATTTPSTTTVQSTAMPTTHATTTEDVSTVAQTTSASPTTQPATTSVATTSATTQPTLPPSTQSRTTEMPTTSMSQTTTDLTTVIPSSPLAVSTTMTSTNETTDAQTLTTLEISTETRSTSTTPTVETSGTTMIITPSSSWTMPGVETTEETTVPHAITHTATATTTMVETSGTTMVPTTTTAATTPGLDTTDVTTTSEATAATTATTTAMAETSGTTMVPNPTTAATTPGLDTTEVTTTAEATATTTATSTTLVETLGTTMAPTPTTAATTPGVDTTEATTVAHTTTAVTTAAASTTPMLETSQIAKASTPVATTKSTSPMVETSAKVTTVKTYVHTTTTEDSTPMKTNIPLPKTTKTDPKKTTASLSKYTTTAKDGDKESQTGDSGGGGNTVVFAAAGATGGVAVLVGVGVTVFICRRRRRDSDACRVPMERLGTKSIDSKPDSTSAEVAIGNPLYGAMDEPNKVSLAVNDSFCSVRGRQGKMTPYGSYVLLVVLMLENPALQGSMGQTCGGTLNRDSPTRNITSPDYPNPIQALITCDWIIEAPTGQVQLRFEEFSFFQTMRCTTSEPTVSIFDGSSISDPSLGRYCGNENGNLAPPDVTVSSSGSLLVHYYSGRYGGAGVAGEGFIATFSFPGVVDCASSPCTNGGTCVNRPDGFLCLCLPEYVGTRCEDTAGVDHCASSPCTNAGTCVNGPDSFQCLCPPEYVGTRCEDAAGVDHCASSPCTNVGTCVNGPDSFQCLCPPEYVGTRCEDAAGVDHCASSPCTNAGTCVNGPDSFQCLCPPEYVGTRCEDAAGVDHCASSPCTNVGTCVNGPDSFQCLCPPEYVGTLCQVSKSSCLLPLGMENGDIEDSQISASTEKTGYEAYKGRLNGPRAWQADVANTNQWLQVNFNNRTIITGIQTQGLWGGHVKSYRLLYGDKEDGLTMYKETGFNNSKIFDANSEGRTVVTSNFSLPILASILRVNPQDFTYNLIRLRLELLGCDDIDHCASSPCINGGTCLNVPDGFQCLCIPEYVGTRCQVSKSSCMLPLGMASGYIEDSQISASTEKTGYESYKGRLNGPRAWQPVLADTNQWLQVNFNNRTIITGIQTQGLWGGHVKSYRLLYGDTEDGLTMYKETAANSSKVFDANSEGTTVVSHDLDAPILTSILRLNPRDFTNNLIRLRLELLGCEDVDHCASSPCTNGGTCVHLTDSYQCMCPPEYVGTQCQVSKASCMLALGMANGDIEDSQISASSEVAGYEAYKGRLNGPRAWEANVSDTNQWLQVNFTTRTIITGIQTQGLWGGHVKSYRLLYGDTENGLSMYRETGSNSSKVFDANSDGTTVVTNGLDVPFITSILRVNPQDFKGTLIRLRMEVLGCGDVVPSASTQSAGLTTQSAYTSAALSTSRTVTTDDVSTVSQTTSALSTTGKSSTQPTVATTSATTQLTFLPSTQSVALGQSSTALTTTTLPVSPTTPRTIAPPVETTTVIVETTTAGTTTVPPPTTTATVPTQTSPIVVTTDTTTAAHPTTAETPAKPTTPKLETTATTKVTTLPPIATTVATRMVETSQTITLPTSVNKMTTGVSTSTTRATNAPLLVKTTKPDDLIKTTKSSTPKHTTAAKEGDKEAQTGDSGGGGNTAVFAAAGAAGGVAVLVGVGVTVFICRRRKMNPEASGVPMQRLDASNAHNTDHSSTDVEIENPLYGAMDGINALGINVTDSSA
ncbi:uncharacterized protein LOC118416254 [Branchiostoma floridae]|uniref:Uncharacterized protein LOC118416254 n=1 Tax=Branchiostoma floridae TaxID=7739 RepID=A0A9J7L715_BRAFL|nr:uncharacterized protein LOC118416254 [Branchiostoma floridae]